MPDAVGHELGHQQLDLGTGVVRDGLAEVISDLCAGSRDGLGSGGQAYFDSTQEVSIQLRGLGNYLVGSPGGRKPNGVSSAYLLPKSAV